MNDIAEQKIVKLSPPEKLRFTVSRLKGDSFLHDSKIISISIIKEDGTASQVSHELNGSFDYYSCDLPII